MADRRYEGRELELFAGARNWKAYWRSHIAPFVRGTVLEVGAGNGNNTRLLENLDYTRWLCVEPDSTLCAELRATLKNGCRTDVMVGTLADVSGTSRFDTILYLDVLEHIDDDRAELRTAMRHLRDGGHLIVLAPAHEWLFSPFDRALGHFRRYSSRTLRDAAPRELSLVFLRYLDAAGMTASLANRLLLKQAMPTAKQLRSWDEYLVPLSRRLDAALRYRLGKSVIGVWRCPPTGNGK
jgi:2-polyprenyl-3-methyl-5-hydroxy-6-metoxy-1,4-benzoquinol methylase